MTVSELIQQLQRFDPKAIVVVSQDAEGNGFSPVVGADDGLYSPDSTWSGQFVGVVEAAESGSVGKLAVCIWPTN